MGEHGAVRSQFTLSTLQDVIGDFFGKRVCVEGLSVIWLAECSSRTLDFQAKARPTYR